ncbi:MAG: flagellar biosynthesis protein FlgE [Deltaproteobacteria bacterium]|nr:MAG: flagellar biosynthesis protein FlgE [Deltaproteobacteria bacterium]
MALSSALFSGISGLTTLGNAMQIIGDNIANVNTIGFKGSTFTFQDLLSQSISTQSGTAQVGRGTALGDIYATFEQGSFESTGNTTDLAIGGDGFFVLRESGSQNLFYSRAGNFRFDKDGYLTNPEGYVVQGWALDENGQDVGSITDIVLDSFTSPPQASTQITVITNLSSQASSNVNNLSNAWDGDNSSGNYISDGSYEYQSTVKVYDSLGSTHDITIYYDPDHTTANQWEFIITCNPSEDARTGATGNDLGLLARGTITFNSSSGTIQDLSMETNDGQGNWSNATISSNGYYLFSPTFITGTPMSVEFNIGTRDANGGVGTPSWANDSLTTTQFATASTTTFQSADGYGAGDLQGVDVDVDGVITGVYSNGQLIPLYRVALAKFQNVQGLRKEGGNLYRETRESGDAITNRPGTNGLGSIAPNSLEQSNVDIANEFVKMITTQRGFQANSKIITVTDQMLAELINLKR